MNALEGLGIIGLDLVFLDCRLYACPLRKPFLFYFYPSLNTLNLYLQPFFPCNKTQISKPEYLLFSSFFIHTKILNHNVESTVSSFLCVCGSKFHSVVPYKDPICIEYNLLTGLFQNLVCCIFIPSGEGKKVDDLMAESFAILSCLYCSFYLTYCPIGFQQCKA